MGHCRVLDELALGAALSEDMCVVLAWLSHPVQGADAG